MKITKKIEEMSLQERVKTIIECLAFTEEIDTRRNQLTTAIADDGVLVTNKRTGRHLWITTKESANEIAGKIKILA